ncbi:hypothetical protein [Amycolatopsis sp. NPDC003731]
MPLTHAVLRSTLRGADLPGITAAARRYLQLRLACIADHLEPAGERTCADQRFSGPGSPDTPER